MQPALRQPVDRRPTPVLRPLEPLEDRLRKLPQLFAVLVDQQATRDFTHEEWRDHVETVFVVNLDSRVAVAHDSLAISRAK